MQKLKLFLVAVLAFAYTSAGAAEIKLNYDVVVIGAGASGTSATMAAAENGAKVLLIEKLAGIGGTGNYAEGIFAAESKMQQRQGIIVTKDFAFKTIMEYSHWLANPYVARAFVDKSADTIEWVKSKGIEFEYIGPGGPGGPLTWHVILGKGHGAHLLRTFHDHFKNMSVDVKTEVAGRSLIMDKGKVVGVMAEDLDSGDTYRITAKAVIVATGGYANNKEMLKKYTIYPDVIMVGNVGKDGDGIKMAWEAGAAEEGIGVFQSYRPALPGYPTASHMLAAARQPYLWVDKNGRRFTDESIVVIWPHSTNALIKAGGIMYSIFDSNTLEYFKKNGIDVQIGEWVLQGTKLDKFDDEFNGEVGKKRYAFKANSVKDLAKQTGMDEKVLQATIEENNRFAAANRDDTFAKNPNYLKPVSKGPFYAVQMLPAALGTLGGVKINGNMEAVDKKDNAIPGLYVVGNDAGGMYGDTYDLLLGGGTFGFALNSGRIAAENAVEYAKIKK